jgi:hypothetical protein
MKSEGWRNRQAPALGPNDDLVSPKGSPLLGGEEFFGSAADEFVLALGYFDDGSAVVMAMSFSFHSGQNKGEGWTNTVQGSWKFAGVSELAARRLPYVIDEVGNRVTLLHC